MKKEKSKNKQLDKGSASPIIPPQNTIAKGEFSDLLNLGIIILIGSLIYSNSFSCSFHLDDIESIVDNLIIRDYSNIKAIWNFSPNRFIPYYSLAVNYHFGALNVWGYHLLNLIIHLINACLVYGLTLVVFCTPILKDKPISNHRRVLALITALLFVSHPLATQSVTYIVQRLASIAALFYLLSLFFYIKARLSNSGNFYKFLLFLGSFGSAVAAFLSKENAYTLPFAIVLIELFFLQTKTININFKNYRTNLLLSGFLIFIIFLFSKYSNSIFKPILPNDINVFTITPIHYLFTQFSVILKYIQLLFLPINLNLDYDYRISTSLFELRTFVSILFLAALVIYAIFLFNRQRIISFGIFWFLLTISIESSFIPINDLIFEHRTYLPSFGFFLIVSSGIYFLFGNHSRKLFISILLVIISLNSFATYQRNKIWKDDLTLWEDVAHKSPGKARPKGNRGNAYTKLKQYDKAIADYTDAIKINPKYTKAYYNRGLAYLNGKQFNDLAIADFTKTIELDSKYVDAYINKGNALRNSKKYDEAHVEYSEALKLKPAYPLIYFNLGNLYMEQQRFGEANTSFTKAIELKADYAKAYCNRGNVYTSLEQYEKAIADYSKAIQLDPNFAIAKSNLEVAKQKLKALGKK